MTQEILEVLKKNSWSADNIAFGSGGALLQKVDRDSQKFAFKASARYSQGQWFDVYKDPVTDPGKKSKRGKLALVLESDGTFRTVRMDELNGRLDHLVEVFRNGELLVDQKFSDIRERAKL